MLVLHSATSTQQDDFSNFQGGPIDISTKLMVNNLVEVGQISAVSDNSLDSDQEYLIDGVTSTGIIVVEAVLLSGTTPVTTDTTFTKIFTITKTSGASLVGSVTFSSLSVVLGTLEQATSQGTGTDITAECNVEITALKSLLPKSTTNPFKEKIFYDKFFILNCDSTQINVAVEEFSDQTNVVDFAFDLTLNSGSLSTNRLVRPINIPVGSFNSLPKTVAVPPSSAIGVWIRVVVPISETSATKNCRFKISDGSNDSFPFILTEETIARQGFRERRYGFPLGGGNPHNYIELAGAKFVTNLFYEPDPKTFRNQFYYNTRINQLFKKLKTQPHPVWKRVR